MTPLELTPKEQMVSSYFYGNNAPRLYGLQLPHLSPPKSLLSLHFFVCLMRKEISGPPRLSDHREAYSEAWYKYVSYRVLSDTGKNPWRTESCGTSPTNPKPSTSPPKAPSS